MKSIIKKTSIIFCFLIFILPTAFAALNVALSDQGTDVITVSTGENLASGSLNIQVWDAMSGGTLVYNETFANAIDNGSWNIMIGENASNPLALEYGNTYYKDYQIVGEDADFTNFTGATVERQFFYSPLGSIGSEDITNGNFTFDTTTLVVDSTNNRVGIGTGTPTDTLHVVGNTNLSGTLHVLNITIDADNLNFNNKAGATRIAINDDAEMGMGGPPVEGSSITAYAAISALNYTGALANNGAMYFVNSSGTLLMSIPAAGGAVVELGNFQVAQGNIIAPSGQIIGLNFSGNAAANGAMFFVNSTGDTLMRITATGNVGIGGAAPGATLDVIGDIQASANITAAEYFGTVPNGGAIYFVNRSNGNNFMEIDSTGRVGIGTAPIGDNVLSVSGDVNSTGAIEAGDFTARTGVTTPEILVPLGNTLIFKNDTEANLVIIDELGDVNITAGDLSVSGISGDGAGQIVCILPGGKLGTCANDPAGDDGDCTCT